jgi:N-acetylneuraminate lyase
VASAKDRLPVIVHVGHTSVAEARELAQHAHNCGAAAICSLCPGYYRFATVARLVDCMAEIAAGAPELPFYYYHVPVITNVPLSMTEFLQRGGESIPTLAGIKYTAPTIHEFHACLELDGGRFEMMFGYDEMLLSAIAVGAQGSVGSTYNLAGPLYARMYQAVEKGDWATARQCQSRSVSFVDILQKYGIREAQKAVMKMLGVDCGPCRLPGGRFDDRSYQALYADLKNLGFFDWFTA